MKVIEDKEAAVSQPNSELRTVTELGLWDRVEHTEYGNLAGATRSIFSARVYGGDDPPWKEGAHRV